MFDRPTRMALVGFGGGCAVVACVFSLELLVRGALGGLGFEFGALWHAIVALHGDSVGIWTVYAMPFVFALTGRMLAPRPRGQQVNDARLRSLQMLVWVLKEQVERQSLESRAKSAYLASMTDELRTPLGAITGYAGLLQEEAEDSGLDLAEDLRKIAGAGHQLVDLINNILDLSKIEIGQLPVMLEDVDMAQVVDEVCVLIAPSINKNGNRFSSRVAPRARLVRGDHMRLRQIIVHLLSNAFKFTKNGQIQLVIERCAPRPHAWIAIKIKDTGVGMTPAEIERTFDEYAQVAERVPGQGGLSLAISYKLARLMDGRIEVESEKGVGSMFTVLLPPSKIAEETIPPRSAVALSERLRDAPVLVIDPEPSGISIMRYLGRAGLVVRLVTDCPSARLAEKPKIVIVDVGIEGAWELVGDLVEEGVRVIATSIRDEDVERGLKEGVTAFLLRPLDCKLILATLERFSAVDEFRWRDQAGRNRD